MKGLRFFPRQMAFSGEQPLILRNNHESNFIFLFVGMNNFEDSLRNKKVNMVNKKKLLVGIDKVGSKSNERWSQSHP